MKAPRFWHNDGLIPLLFSPLGVMYGKACQYYFSCITPWKPPIPVICVGNIVAGGAGKTPIAMDIGQRLASQGVTTHFLSRGYGGHLKGPVLVDPARHSAREVGDEPLNLARFAPTWISRKRILGVKAAANAGAEAVVMDDGFQNPYLEKNLSLLVIDAEYGVGNGRVIPAGPMREPLSAALERADVLVVLGKIRKLPAWLNADKPIHRAVIIPGPEFKNFRGKRVLAFSGIGRPKKFFNLLRSCGANVVASFEFPDHHFFSESEIVWLKRRASDLKAILVSTEKDVARLSPSDKKEIEVLTVSIFWHDEMAIEELLVRQCVGGKC
ncbi:MAG: tetraacyldisaccharide 4'-kinase [Magnetovibrio sp.]|nr:tetraacyldisaccharide 4'-kinase [Magnetovibrio sp.]